MVVACISLFVALTGAGTAAVVALKKGQVKSIHIGTGQVKRADIAANAVNSAKVADGSLLVTDFAAGQLSPGPQGLPGPPGPPPRVTGALSVGFDTPPPLSGFVLADLTVEMAEPGRLLLTAQLNPASGPAASVTCSSAGACDLSFGVYIDGVPVAETRRRLQAGPNATRTLPAVLTAGIAPNVAAGSHLVQFAVDESANVTTHGFSVFGQVQAVAIDDA